MFKFNVNFRLKYQICDILLQNPWCIFVINDKKKSCGLLFYYLYGAEDEIRTRNNFCLAFIIN